MDALNEAFAEIFPNLGPNDLAAFFENHHPAGIEGLDLDADHVHLPAAADLVHLPAAADHVLVPHLPAAADHVLVPHHPAAADLGLLPHHPAAADLGLLPHNPAHANQEAALGDLLPDQEVEIAPNLNPWKLVHSRKYGRIRRNEPEVYPPTPPVRVAQVEVEWVPKTGTLRSVRKHAQDRKSGYLSTEEGPGFYSYPCYVPPSEY